jgi:hypothetical protein
LEIRRDSQLIEEEPMALRIATTKSDDALTYPPEGQIASSGK